MRAIPVPCEKRSGSVSRECTAAGRTAGTANAPGGVGGVILILKDLLVATDFEETDASALACGRDLARQYGARLHILNVVDNLVVMDTHGRSTVGRMLMGSAAERVGRAAAPRPVLTARYPGHGFPAPEALVAAASA
jgi:hypothetical protein